MNQFANSASIAAAHSIHFIHHDEDLCIVVGSFVFRLSIICFRRGMIAEELVNVFRYDHIIEKTLNGFSVARIARVQFNNFIAAFLCDNMSGGGFPDSWGTA